MTDERQHFQKEIVEPGSDEVEHVYLVNNEHGAPDSGNEMSAEETIAMISAEEVRQAPEAELLEIEEAIGATPEEVREIKREMGIMDAIARIAVERGYVSEDTVQKIRAWDAHRFLNKATDIVALSVAIGTGVVASNEVEPPLPQEVSVSTPQMREFWNEKEADALLSQLGTFGLALSTSDKIASVKSLHEDSPERDKEVSKLERGVPPLESVDPVLVEGAITFLEQKMASYPKEMWRDMLSDEQFMRACTFLSRIAKVDLSPNLENITDDQFEKIRDAQIHARMLFAELIRLHEDELVESLKGKIEKNDTHAISQGISLLNAYVDTATFLVGESESAQIFDSPEFAALDAVPELAEKVYAQLDPLRERARDSHNAELLAFLAKAGHQEGAKALAEKIAKHKISLDRVPTLFQDSNLVDRLEIQELNPKLKWINQGGKLVATELLRAYQIDPGDYLPYWTELQNSAVNGQEQQERENLMMLHNRRMKANAEAVASLEKGEPGSLTRLTNEYGIRFPGRYPIELLREQLKAESAPPTPYGVAFSALTDNNGAFDEPLNVHIRKLYHDAKNLGSTVRVVEAGSQQELILRSLSLLDKNKGQKAEFEVISGHGDKHRVAMGRGGQYFDEKFFGIGGNRTSLVFNGPVLFNSCSTGTHGGVAQRISSHSEGAVIGPDRATFIEELGLKRTDGSGKMAFSVSYSGKHTRARTYANGKEIGENMDIDAGSVNTSMRY